MPIWQESLPSSRVEATRRAIDALDERLSSLSGAGTTGRGHGRRRRGRKTRRRSS